jgi:hypothetical protein
MKKRNELISGIAPLKPHAIWDVKTGEALSFTHLETNLDSLVSFVQAETARVFEEETAQIIEDATELKGSANSYGRQRGYSSNYDALPREVLAKSRINELFLYKLMSEVASYAKNDNPKKQHPTFPKTINLGAVDKQMASLSREGNVLTLLFKCWDREYLIDFILPSYLLERDIIKFSLPLVRYTNKGYEFIFTVKENIPVLSPTKLKAGVDLGRVEPYTLAVVNAKGNRIAHYTTSGRLKELNRKRENILSHKHNIYAKIDQYEKLRVSIVTLVTEKSRLGNKARILGNVIAQNIGAEISNRLAKHSLNTLNVENLSWVKGEKYGSKWNHSRQQDTITHALARTGVRVKKVNPKNSSQLCHACGTKLVHSNRKARCAGCQTILDRDYNAALNIASQRHLTKRYPSLDNNRLAGGNCSPQGQVIDHLGHSSVPKKNLSFLKILT